MNLLLQPQIPARLVARLAEGNFGVADPLLGANGPPIPSALEVRDLIEDLRDVLFPGLTDGRDRRVTRSERELETRLEHIAARLIRQIDLAIAATGPTEAPSAQDSSFSASATNALLHELPRLRLALVDDALAAIAGDPAARSVAEVILCYPGHYAITVHRLAHILWSYKVPLLPRMMSEHAHRVTGIDLHPGAHIGASFFIDHGTGVVVGETSIIGAQVRLYQGVTLGALSLSKSEVDALRNGPKRHPTIEDQVIVYANATILGGNTVVGRGSVIEGSAWVTQSVPPGSNVSRSGLEKGSQ
jgi:serine O-acetyltransferase